MNVYLGPYVECKYRPATRTKTFPACVSAGCAAHGVKLAHGRPRLAKYCQQCGGPIGGGSEQVPDRPHFYEVIGEDDVLIDLDPGSDSAVILGSNMTDCGLGGRRMHFGGEAHVDVSASGRLVAEDATLWVEIEWFVKEYPGPLEKLRGAYDVSEVRWGLHIFYR